MEFYVDILEPKQDIQESVDLMARTIGPIYQECWQKMWESRYGKPYDLHAQLFLNMWFTGGSKIFVAYDLDHDRAVVGFLCGILYRPLQYNAHVFQVQEWYARGHGEVEDALFGKAVNALRYIGCDEIRIASVEGQRIPKLDSSWEDADSFTVKRYVKV